jgi:predicted adenylyl cyclase CyaB
MREIEVKAVLPDVEEAERRLRDAGAKLEFRGALEDRRYDTEDGALAERGEVLRIRTYRSPKSVEASLDWKGPSGTEKGYKVREEIATPVNDPAALAELLERLGYEVVREVDRQIIQYRVAGAMVRIEIYPRMDTLVEVEGEPDAIEAAIDLLGMNRGEFGSDTLAAFVTRFERRTGVRSAISYGETRG